MVLEDLFTQQMFVNCSVAVIYMIVDTFDGAKPRFLNRGKKRRSVLTLRIPRASALGVEWVDGGRQDFPFKRALFRKKERLRSSPQSARNPAISF